MPILSSIIDCLASPPLQPNAAIAYIQCTTPPTQLLLSTSYMHAENISLFCFGLAFHFCSRSQKSASGLSQHDHDSTVFHSLQMHANCQPGDRLFRHTCISQVQTTMITRSQSSFGPGQANYHLVFKTKHHSFFSSKVTSNQKKIPASQCSFHFRRDRQLLLKIHMDLFYLSEY